MRTYSELKKLKTFEERFRYLKLNGRIGIETFGFDRYLNQVFYTSPEWRNLRNHILARDNGGDMGLLDYPINGRILVHHMNPICAEDIVDRNADILNPEYLISVGHDTHNAIHYGDESLLRTKVLIERYPGDTDSWERRAQ